MEGARRRRPARRSLAKDMARGQAPRPGTISNFFGGGHAAQPVAAREDCTTQEAGQRQLHRRQILETNIAPRDPLERSWSR